MLLIKEIDVVSGLTITSLVTTPAEVFRLEFWSFRARLLAQAKKIVLGNSLPYKPTFYCRPVFPLPL